MPISGHVPGAAPTDLASGGAPSVLVAQVADRVAMVRARIDAARARGGHDHDVTLVAVTKTHGPDAVRAAWAAGVADVGENKVQEADQKRGELSDLPLRWHMIGHLQRNKAKRAATYDLVHGLDRTSLVQALDAAARDAGVVCDVLVQVNVSGEESKGGFAPSELSALTDVLHTCAGLRVCGAMTMAPYDADEHTLRAVFAGARSARDTLAAAGLPATLLSMGMSGDYEIAVEEGATHVRLGTILFGERDA